MDHSTIKSWIIYCWRGIEDGDIDYMMKVWRIAKDSEEDGCNVRLDGMQYYTEKRLWDQLIDKISEFEINSELNDRDSFLFIVSRNMLDKEAFSKELAYTSGCAPNYPDKDKRLIGLMYV